MNKGDETSHRQHQADKQSGPPKASNEGQRGKVWRKEGGTLRPKCKKVRGFFWVSGEGKTWEKYGEIGGGEKRRGERETPDIAFSIKCAGSLTVPQTPVVGLWFAKM